MRTGGTETRLGGVLDSLSVFAAAPTALGGTIGIPARPAPPVAGAVEAPAAGTGRGGAADGTSSYLFEGNQLREVDFSYDLIDPSATDSKT